MKYVYEGEQQSSYDNVICAVDDLFDQLDPITATEKEEDYVEQ